MYRLAESSLSEGIRLRYLKVVRPKVLADINGEDVCPRPVPNLARKRVIMVLPFFLNLPSQGVSQSTVSGICQSFLLKICSETLLAPLGLQPCHVLAWASGQTRQATRYPNCEWTARLVAADDGNRKLSWVDTNSA